MPALIGITTYGQDEERKFPLPREYVDCVRRAGGVAVLIPPGGTANDRLFDSLDGLILAGGGDIDPATYGGANHESIYSLDTERDATELDLAKRAINDGMPTLAICRGMQLINVALGGTLIEHLPDVVGESILHRLPPREPTMHAVEVDADSRLAGILGVTGFEAASWHHQAVRRVAAELNIVAHAPDGIIEAAELRSHPWLYAVQWHPELTADRDERQQRLFSAFVSAANGQELGTDSIGDGVRG